MHGAVTDCSTGQVIEGAVLDVWETLLVGFMGSDILSRRTTIFGAASGRHRTEDISLIAYDQGPSEKLIELLERHP